MTEIRTFAAPPVASTGRAGAAAELGLKLLQPLQGLLSAGESGSADVVEVKPGSPDFQVILRLSLGEGRQTLLRAQTTTAVELGTAYKITALSDSRLQASLAPAAQQPLDSLDPVLLPSGSRLQARVLGSQPNEGGTGYRTLATLIDTPLAGRTLLLENSRPLGVGSLLTAEVRDNLSLAVIPLAGRLDQLHVGEQLGGQFARQASLQALFAALQGGTGQPAEVRQAADRLLALLPDLQQLTDPGRLAQTLLRSGAFLEAGLLGGESAQGDLKAGLLRLIAQLMPNLPGSSPLASAPHNLGLSQALPAFARQMLGSLGHSARDQAQDFPLGQRLPPGLGEEGDLESLLKLAAAAVARLQTHQLSSLAQTQTTPEGLQLTTWQAEIPLRTGAEVSTLQTRIQREEDSPTRSEQERRETLWRIELAFELPPLGPLQVQAQLVGGRLSSQLWAEQRQTAGLIDSELPWLRERLESAGLQVSDLSCRQGQPPQGPRTRLEQRFVDETA